MNFAILISSHGRGAMNIIQAHAEKKLNKNLKLLISEKPDAAALKMAKKCHIATAVIQRKNFEHAREFEMAYLEMLKEHDIDFLFLAGFKRLIKYSLLEQYPNKIINIHPSLLPSFKGINVIQKAMDYGVEYTGLTTHLIDQNMDEGIILHQVPIRVRDKSFEEVDQIFNREGIDLSIKTINHFQP